jgi:predicted HTH transcriptional regulator
MAITVIGGLTSATFLTLVVVPGLYLSIGNFIERRLKRKVEAEKIKEKEKIISVEEKPVPLAKPKEEALFTKEQEKLLKSLNNRQRRTIEYLKEKRKITRVVYIEMFNVSVSTAARDLKELQDKGLIVAKGPLGKGRWYELKIT